MPQVQCPNCSGYKTHKESFLALHIFMTAITGGLWCIVLIAVAVAHLLRDKSSITYECDSCGYKWDMPTGDGKTS
jgi:rubredoxin